MQRSDGPEILNKCIRELEEDCISLLHERLAIIDLADKLADMKNYEGAAEAILYSIEVRDEYTQREDEITSLRVRAA
jgi:hypothetical protein